MPEETVRIQDAGFPDGLVINKEDFDPKTHKLFVSKPEPEPAENADDQQPKPNGGDDGKKTDTPTAQELAKKTKDELIRIAESKGVDIASPDDVTKAQIIQMITEA